MSTLFRATTHARHAHLPRQQNVLARLRHRPVRRRHHQDRPVHLRRAGDHVLDVVGVARAVHVRVVPLGGLVLHVRHRNRDPARLLLRRVVDRVETAERHLRIVLAQHLRDRRRQGRLAVINVPDRPDVDVRLAAIKFLFRHRKAPDFRSGLEKLLPRFRAGRARPGVHSGALWQERAAGIPGADDQD